MKAVLYARFSPRPGAGDCDSAKYQLQRCLAYCKAHDYDVVFARADRYRSGANDDRPGLQACLDRACKEKAILVAYRLSRVARSASDALKILKRLQDHKASLAFVQEGLNFQSPMGKFMFTIMAAFAELEREQISERTSIRMREHQTAGRLMGRPDRCPFGMIAQAGRLVAEPKEQQTIALIEEYREAGKSYLWIANRLQALGVPARGPRWHASTVFNIVKRKEVS